MIKKQLILAAAAAITFASFGGAASAADSKAEYADEVHSCVAEIGRHANYDEATRVRHTVDIVRETRLRYVFTIETSVFTDSDVTAEREYTAYCVARGSGEPLKFRIAQSAA